MSKYSDEISKVPPESFAERWPVIAPEMLTKREQFAMAAMQGILSNSTLGYDVAESTVASCAANYADALLAELERTK